MSEPALTIDGKREAIQGVPIHRTLLQHLRLTGRVGTKEGCAEGDCGACTVAMIAAGSDSRPRYQAVNSCLIPLVALADRQVVTASGLSRGDDLHPVQAAMVRLGGSQCGYCTPGFVMSLFAAYYNRELDDHAVEGNLCRCTGYLPIRRAIASLGEPAADDPFRQVLEQAPLGRSALHYRWNGSVFSRPTSLAEVIALLTEHPDARLIAGGTDLGVEISKFHRRFPLLVSLEAVPELGVVEDTPDYLEIGAGVPLSHIEGRLAGTFPALDEMLRWFAARQIRNRATLGGNLGTASPIGDLPPVLLSLDARVMATGPTGERSLPMATFFPDYRQTALTAGEIIRAIRIPKGLPKGATNRLAQAYKVGKRGTDDISIVAAAFTIDLDVEARVVQARLSYGGVAPTPVRASDVEELLVGRPWNSVTVREAAAALREAFTPISDHRGSAAYRRALAGNLFIKFHHQMSGKRVAS